MNICFLTKAEKPGVNEAISFTKELSEKTDVYFGESSDSFPLKAKEKDYDLFISYISPWIVPKTVLDNTKKWNINFHPGPPEYPGIGCFNFAIYDAAKEFGATAHIMEPKVDSGRIVGVERFSMSENETVETLSNKTYESLYYLYEKTMSFVIKNNDLPKSKEIWKKKPYTRIELEELATIRSDMSLEEIKKRIRATYFPGKPAPFIDLYRYKFEYNPNR